MLPISQDYQNSSRPKVFQEQLMALIYGVHSAKGPDGRRGTGARIRKDQESR